MLVVRRRAPKYFPQSDREKVAEALRWKPETVDRSLVGDGWAWVPARGESQAAFKVVEQLRAAGMQAGMVTPMDANDVGGLREYNRISVGDGEGFVLHGPAGSLPLGAEEAGGAALLGLRWDGEHVRPFTQFVKKPGLLVWGTKGPLGVIWLREEGGTSGLSAMEMASFLRQAVANRGLRLVDDSYRPDDIPTMRAGLAEVWKKAGGHADDVRALGHGVMLRAMERGGVLRPPKLDELPDINQPLKVYQVRKHGFELPDLVRLFAWISAVGFIFLMGLGRASYQAEFAGIAAGLFGIAHGLRIVSRWFRLFTRPTERVRSMAMGPVRIEGKLEAAMHLVSPMRGLRCVYYVTRRQQKSRHGYGRAGLTDAFSPGSWRTVTTSRSPLLPFYVNDGTGRVLVDSAGADWHGAEKYVHKISTNERIIEYVVADGVQGTVFGVADVDPDAPAIEALRDGLNAMFLAEAADAFDLNRDGIISDVERAMALRALDEQMQRDGTNVTLRSGVYLRDSREEPLIVASKRGFSLSWTTILAASAWLAFGMFAIVSTFVYREEVGRFLEWALRVVF